MTRIFLPALTGLIAVILGFAVVLHMVPGFLMDRAMARIDAVGGETNTVWHGPPTGEASRRVVRPSPDILYSVCLYDLRGGPLVLDTPWPTDGSYASVSFYDGRTNNFAVVSDRDAPDLERDGNPGQTSIMLRQVSSGQLALTQPELRNGEDVQFLTDSPVGLALYRRVVVNGTDLSAADSERRGFSCHHQAQSG